MSEQQAQQSTGPMVTSPSINLPAAPSGANTIGVFASLDNFVNAQRMANVLAASSMVPKEFQGNVANCVIALELASRLGASPFMIMQNLDVIHGKPALRATFLIGTVNTCGRFMPLSYEFRGNINSRDDDDAGCRAIGVERSSGLVLEGTWITWRMVKSEGWLSKNGSKWSTMPEQMFRYRAASFWTRAYAPDVMLGMQTAEEAREIVVEAEEVPRAPAVTSAPGTPAKTVEVAAGMAGLASALDAALEPKPEPAKKLAPTSAKGFDAPRTLTPDELAAGSKRE